MGTAGVAAFMLLQLACPGPDRPEWDWRAHVRLANGSEVASSDSDARPVLLVFSSSWATPCAPLLDDLAGFRERSRILVVKADRAAPALPNDTLDFEVVEPTDDELLVRMEVTVLPTLVLLDRSGKAVQRIEGYGSDVADLIDAALQETAVSDGQ